MFTVEEDRLDELNALSRYDEDIFYKTAPLTRQGKEGMMEIPLPFKENDPVFTCNRSTARNRTINTLYSLKRKNPKTWQCSLDKFAKNLNCAATRFVPVPLRLRGNQQRRAYWTPLFSVWQKKRRG